MTHRLEYSRIERERRYLLRVVPADLAPGGGRRIEDRYITGTRLRLRRTRDGGGRILERKLTQKIDVDATHRIVTTVDVDEPEYERLAALPCSTIVKHRHAHAWRGLEYGIDVFEGPLDGLALAEVEVASDESLASLPAPPFAHCEVTAHAELGGGRLAVTDPAETHAFVRRLLAAPPDASAEGEDGRALVVRELRATDAPVLAAAFAAMGWSKPESEFHRYVDESRRGVRAALVAQRGASLAGYVTIAWRSDYAPFRAAGIPEIVDLNVLIEHRRRGVASALLDEAEARIAPLSREAGIAVGLHPGYNAAQRLYGLRGYVPDARGVTHHGVPVAEGDSAPFDDDLVLHLVKPL
jgi:CYTH domain-containing protein